MKGSWCYWKEHFSAAQCDDIIERALTLPAAEGSVGSNAGYVVNPDIRRSQIRWINRTDAWETVWAEIERITKRSNDDWFDVRYNHLPALQFSEYDAAYKGEYKSHQDVFLDSGTDTQRKISFVIQLSDPNSYEGGDLTFQHISQAPPAADIRQRGTVIFFPSLIYHQMNPVTAGVRYSLVGWWEGPAWR